MHNPYNHTQVNHDKNQDFPDKNRLIQKKPMKTVKNDQR